jgi:heme exporter protein D
MSFELLDAGVVSAFATFVVLAAVVGVALLVTDVATTLMRHRPVRLARRESVPTYYRGLVHAH